MENKKLKLLLTGKKGILLQTLPDSLESLYQIIESYYQINTNNAQITFKDREKDECEILDNSTYIAACSEFSHKVTLTITIFNSIPISRLINISENRKTLKYFIKQGRKMALFDVESESLQ